MLELMEIEISMQETFDVIIRISTVALSQQKLSVFAKMQDLHYIQFMALVKGHEECSPSFHMLITWHRIKVQ